MKLLLRCFCASALLLAAAAFRIDLGGAAAPSRRRAATPVRPRGLSTAQTVRWMSSEGEPEAPPTATAANEDAYAALGFQESEIGVGLNPEEVMQWLGTKTELLVKFKKDNPLFSEEKVQEEVDRFVRDTEMVNVYIAYQKRKASPDYKEELLQQNADNFNDPKIIGTYVAWLAGGIGFAYVKNKIVNPKFASGEWEGISIKLPFVDQINALTSGAADAAGGAASDAVAGAADAAAGSF